MAAPWQGCHTGCASFDEEDKLAASVDGGSSDAADSLGHADGESLLVDDESAASEMVLPYSPYSHWALVAAVAVEQQGIRMVADCLSPSAAALLPEFFPVVVTLK